VSRAARTTTDLVALAVAAWYLLAPDFDAMPGGRLPDAVALFVIGLSLWRIWRRWRAG
jgi:hypothetical protein